MGRLLLINALDMTFRELKLRRDPACPICGDNPTIKELIYCDQYCGIVPPSPEENADHPDEVTVQDMKKALDDPSLGIKVIDVRLPHEMAAAPISRGEPDEYEIAKIEGVALLPLSQINARLLNSIRTSNTICTAKPACVR